MYAPAPLGLVLVPGRAGFVVLCCACLGSRTQGVHPDGVLAASRRGLHQPTAKVLTITTASHVGNQLQQSSFPL
ncbi:hypothetical protein LZ31DRAFT_94246 [Colletotrichum somersetense]|nr:hypothetical protein LZ31DRAFT_94246 [Colletotrichum somersetense]